MIAFVQPDPMGGSAMKRCGLCDGTVLLLHPDQAGVFQDAPGIGLSFEITKGLYGKENAVYPQQQGVE
jgi:hypothetical protein